MNHRDLNPSTMLIDRDSRTVEGRCDPAAAAGGERRSLRPRLASAGPSAPPPMEAAWLEIVGCVPLRRARGDADGAGIFPVNRQQD
jgi:hypothetical protein